jgi:hypothetical protein
MTPPPDPAMFSNDSDRVAAYLTWRQAAGAV